MATAKKTSETFGERQTKATTEADNVVKGKTEVLSRKDLKHDTSIVDVQAEINKQVEEAQGAKGSTASDKPGPKA